MPDFIEQLRGRLAELGCPKSQVRRLVREVADHREDLKQAALSEGLSDAEAEARANAKLGDPRSWQSSMMAMLRRFVLVEPPLRHRLLSAATFGGSGAVGPARGPRIMAGVRPGVWLR